MYTNPHLVLDLCAARAIDLRAEANRDRLARALRRRRPASSSSAPTRPTSAKEMS